LNEPPAPAQDRAQWVTQALSTHESRLIAYATRLTGDIDRARDVVQDTFLRLCQADRSKVDGHLTQWLYTVCRNRALDIGRKEQRMTALSEHQAGTTAAPPTASGPSAEVAEATTTVFGLIDKLPDRQREAVRLKFHGGLTYREISEVMNTTVNNVGVLIHTALKSIRESHGEVTS
jgi:RNA polymerase sigma factor (sigma-70 family)